MKNFSVVVDSSLAVFTVVDSELSQLATRAWNHLLTSSADFFAPGLWVYETTSVIRKLNSFGKITESEAEKALIILDQLSIQFIPDEIQLRKSALKWAIRLRQKSAYDGFYLAGAEQLGAEFWTADHSLFKNAHQLGVGWVHWMGELA